MSDTRIEMLQAQISLLEEKIRFLQEASFLDDVTGLYNRRGLMELGRREVLRAHRYARPLTVMVAAIDQFQRVEEVYGPATARHILRDVALVLNTHLRATDLIGRIGDDMFVLVLPETNAAGAQYVAKRLTEAVAGTMFATGHATVYLSISVGIEVYAPEADEMLESFNTLVKRALAALEEARSTGRGVIVVWVPLLGEEPFFDELEEEGPV